MNTGNQFFGPTSAPCVILPFRATTVLDMSAGNSFEMTLAGNLSLSNPINVINDGQPLLLRLIQDGAGSRTLTLSGAQFRFGTTITAITLTTTPGATDYIGMLWNKTAQKWDILSLAQGF